MKQVGQRARDGGITVLEVPEPTVAPGWVLVDTRWSLISAGTERTKVETGGKNLVQKARARPDLARKVVDQARVQGIRSTLGTVRDRLDAQTAIGYSSAGVVRAVGVGVEGVQPGDRVACGGGGWASHAEVVSVPRNLVVPVPDTVGLDAAAYATVGSIALHAVRRAEASLGETVGVVGLGLVGQLAVRILAAAGCSVVGIDLDPAAIELASVHALALRRDDPALDARVREATGGLGLDSVLVCAATRSSDPLELAAHLARDRGRLVVVGDVQVAADRGLLYEKELEVRLSRSYGAGRYLRDYEERGRDLPPGYVRWTEGRNMAAFVGLLAAGRVDVAPLTTHRFPVADAAEAYGALTSGSDGRAFGILLDYGEPAGRPRTAAPPVAGARTAGAVRVGFLGAGGFARSTLVPAFQAAGAELVAVASGTGLTAADAAARYGFGRAVAPEELLAADDVDAVVVATRHGSHARLAAAALAAGKAVFVEKPLALTHEELDDVEAALDAGGVLAVGFNRRYAPLTARLREALPPVAETLVSIRVNAGPLPADHWLHDVEDGGGRLVGEGCHFVDLAAYLGGAAIADVHAAAAPVAGRPLDACDSFVVTLTLADGSVAVVTYSGGGDPRLPKERVECFGGGLAAVLDDFRRLELWRGGRREVVKSTQDKGHRAEVAAFVAAVRGEGPPPDGASFVNSSRATLAALDSLRSGQAVTV